jgi:RNA polymerase sigma factor (sigma-70 family)
MLNFLKNIMKEQDENRMDCISVDAEVSQLLSLLVSGDVKAFSRLYDLHVNMLFNYGCRLTTDKELLKDCIHDVFIKIFSKREDLSEIANFKSYLFISLKNKLCDESRKRINYSDQAVEELNPVASENVEDDYINFEMDCVSNEKVKFLLNQLPPRQKEALTLYYIEEKKYEDICVLMDMNYQSVRNLIHRGILKLRSIAV